MQQIAQLTKKYQVQTKVQHEFQQIALDMQQFFPKSQNSLIWSIFYKKGFTESRVLKAFEICKDKDIKNIRYLIAIINNQLI